MTKIPEVWLDDYLRRSGGHRLFTDENLVVNEHGFSTCIVTDEGIHIGDVYGDGAYWDAYFSEMAKQHPARRMVFLTQRNPHTYARKYGYKIDGYVMAKEFNDGSN